MVLVWAVHGWMAGLLVKECSAFAKNVCHMLSAAVGGLKEWFKCFCKVMYFFPFMFIIGPVNNGPVTACALLARAP